MINKVDLPSADVAKVTTEIVNLLGCEGEEIIPVSAKTGENVESILDAVVERIQAPRVFNASADHITEELKALVFDSQYDAYR